MREDPKKARAMMKDLIYCERGLRAFGSIDAITPTSKRRRPRSYVGSMDSNFSGIEDRRTMIATARDLELNFSLLRGLTSIHCRNVVGTGPRLQSRTKDTGWNDRKEAWFRNWGRRCDVRGILSWAKFVTIFERRMKVDGDVGVILTSKVKLQPIEADRISDPPRNKIEEGKSYVHGVEVDKQLVPKAYHVYDRPATGRRHQAIYQGRKPARNFIHYFDPERFDQTRGMSAFIAAINDCQDLRESLEAVKGTFKLENMAGIGIVSAAAESADTGSGFFGNRTDYDITNAEGNTETRKEIKINQGFNILELAEGEDLKTWDKKTPGSNFEPYMLFQARLAGLSLNMPLEIALQYFSRGSFSTLKGALGQYSHSIDVDRQWIEEAVLSRIQRWVTRSGIALYLRTNGERGLQPPDEKLKIDVDDHDWQWDQLPILESEKQIKSDVVEYKARTTTLKDMNARRNRDWEATARQQARESKRLREIEEEEGVPSGTLDPQISTPGEAPTNAETEDNDNNQDGGDDDDS